MTSADLLTAQLMNLAIITRGHERVISTSRIQLLYTSRPSHSHPVIHPNLTQRLLAKLKHQCIQR